MTATTFRAAYIPAEPGSIGVGILLTGPEHADLSDADLMAAASAEWDKAGDGTDVEIVIGDWTE
jgi:hypothetical protein